MEAGRLAIVTQASRVMGDGARIVHGVREGEQGRARHPAAASEPRARRRHRTGSAPSYGAAPGGRDGSGWPAGRTVDRLAKRVDGRV